MPRARRVICNVESLASLFFTKTVYAFVLAIAVGVAMLPFPFLPRQLTLIAKVAEFDLHMSSTTAIEPTDPPHD